MLLLQLQLPTALELTACWASGRVASLGMKFCFFFNSCPWLLRLDAVPG